MATPRLKEKYNNEVRDKLYKELELTNVNQVPRLEKIVVNMGVGRAAGDSRVARWCYRGSSCHHWSAADGHPCKEVHRRFPSA